MKDLKFIRILYLLLALSLLTGCASIEKWLDKEIAKEEALLSETTPAVEPTHTSQTNTGTNASGSRLVADDLPAGVTFLDAKWHGIANGASAKLIGPIENLRIDSKNFHYTQPPRCKEWKYWKTNNGKNVNSYACFMVLRNGRLEGGRFDDCSWSRNSRERKNIADGYTGGIIPANGEDVWFFLMNKDCTERTTAGKVKW